MASAPAKVILVGEHFVVKGARAVAASVGLRVRVRARPLQAGPSIVESVDLGARGELDGLAFRGDERLAPLARVVEALEAMGYRVPPFHAVIESQVPPGAGLGSSASTSAAFALALSALAGDPLDPQGVSRAAYEAEVLVHGRPSGIDNTVVAWGGGLVYRRGEEPRRIKARLPEGYTLLIVDTGVPRRTGDVVRRVLDAAEALWPAASHLYRAADRLADIVVEALESGDMERLGLAFNLAHGMLHALGASSRILDTVVHEARAAGALGAKLTGAGVGGCAIVLVEESTAGRVAEALRPYARRVLRAELGVEGARLEGARARGSQEDI